MTFRGLIGEALGILESSMRKKLWVSFSIHREGRTTTINRHLTCRVIRMHWRVFSVISGMATILVSWVIAVDALRHFPQFSTPNPEQGRLPEGIYKYWKKRGREHLRLLRRRLFMFGSGIFLPKSGKALLE